MRKISILGGWALAAMGFLGCDGGNSAPPSSTPTPPIGTVVTVHAGPALHAPRYYHRAVTLPDGRIAVLGGADPNGTPVASCEIVEADGSSVRNAGSLLFPRMDPEAILLGTGKVALLGGDLDNHGTVATQIEVWDPRDGTSTYVGDLKTLHGDWSTSVPLPDGRIFLFGGAGWGDPELIDPATWTTEVIPFPGGARGGGALAALPSGNVVIAGGTNGMIALGDRWIYDWQSKVFTLITGVDGPLAYPRADPGSVVLKDGRWVILGGGGDFGQPGLTSVEIYASPDGHRLAVTQGATGFVSGSTTLLTDGRVLLVGGASVSGFSTTGVPNTRVYDPSSGTARNGQSLAVGRSAHTATRLADGRVLIAGGSTGQGALASTEILEVH